MYDGVTTAFRIGGDPPTLRNDKGGVPAGNASSSNGYLPGLKTKLPLASRLPA